MTNPLMLGPYLLQGAVKTDRLVHVMLLSTPNQFGKQTRHGLGQQSVGWCIFSGSSSMTRWALE